MKNTISASKLVFLSISISLLASGWQLHYSSTSVLWDEGFLWYGVQRVMAGEIPIRDFMAYDPGRYYASSALMGLWGDDGLVSLRCAMMIFQAIALFVGLLIIDTSIPRKNTLYSLLCGVVLVSWTTPYFKMPDFLASLLLLGALGLLVHRPTRTRYLLVGLCVGLTAILGRNHGVYGMAGSLGTLLWLSIKSTKGPSLGEGLTLWAIGIIVGFSPILLMLLLAPGFATAFWRSILFIFEYGATNIGLPVPWPWLINVSSPLSETMRKITVGLLFIAIASFAMLSVLWIISQRMRNSKIPPGLVGASFLAAPYVHYAYSRADIVHLALGIFPFLIGCLICLAWLPARLKWTLVLASGVVSAWTTSIVQTAWPCVSSGRCIDVSIGGKSFIVDAQMANDIGPLQNLRAKYASDGRPFIAVPFWPGAYSILERKSPLWEIYALFPRSPPFEEAEIERMKAAKPAFAVIADFALDGHEDFKFQITHPLTYKYIVDHFDSVPGASYPPYQVFKSRGGS